MCLYGGKVNPSLVFVPSSRDSSNRNITPCYKHIGSEGCWARAAGLSLCAYREESPDRQAAASRGGGGGCGRVCGEAGGALHILLTPLSHTLLTLSITSHSRVNV